MRTSYPSEDSAPPWGPSLACVAACFPRLSWFTLEPSSPRPVHQSEEEQRHQRPVCKALGRGSFRSVLVTRFVPSESCRSHLHSLRHGSGSSTMWPREVVPGWPSMRPEATAGSRGGKGASPREPSVLAGTGGCGQGETRVLPDTDPASWWTEDQPVSVTREATRPAEGVPRRGREGIKIPLDP